MVKVILHNQAKDQSIELKNAEMVTVGRGFFDCQDKRVSRKHGELTVLDNKLNVKACHVNPIFYKKNGETQSQVLAKNKDIILADKDKFSLLPNEFEYEIKVIDDQQVADDQIPNNSVANHANMETRVNDNMDLDQTLVNGFDITQVQPENIQSSSSGAMQNASNRKRSFDGNEEEKNLKRRKSLNSDANNVEAQQNTVNNQVQPEGDEEPAGNSNQTVATTPAVPTVIIKPDPGSVDAQQSAAATSNDNIIKIKPDPDAPSSATASTSSTIVKTGATVKTEPSVTKTENANTPNQTSGVPSNQNQPSLRPSCRYGIRCYLASVEHRAKQAHPLDPDYRRPDWPPAPANVRHCPFWESCYRRNPVHFRNFNHPSSSVYSIQPVVNVAPAINVAPVVQNAQNIQQNDNNDEDEDDFDNDDSDVDRDFELNEEVPSEDDLDEEENNLEE